MKFRWFALLGLISLGINAAVSHYQTMPGYMDADYYFANALRIYQGHGWTENFLWNYLDEPEGIPHPAFLYWMPLASIIGSMGLKITGMEAFSSARIGFLVIAASISPLTAWLAFKLGKKKNTAMFAGVLALFPGYYLPYLTTTETFGIYMVLGGCFLLLAGTLHGLYKSLEKKNSHKFATILTTILLGINAGLMHLARADGILWLLLGGGLLIYLNYTCLRESGLFRTRFIFRWVTGFPWPAIIYILGYTLVMFPWFHRNYALYGNIFPEGSMRTFWLVDYDDLFIFPPSELNRGRWLDSGITNLIVSRLWSLGQNLKTMIAVQGFVILLPLIFWGIWKTRVCIQTRLGVIGWLGIWSLMTVIYPFQGGRGGYFHSGAAVQLLLWVLAAVGFDSFICWGIKQRGWEYKRAWRAFSTIIIGMIIAITFSVVWQLVARPESIWSKVDSPYNIYGEIDHKLELEGASSNEIVMVNNPPGYTASTGRSAIVIPDGDPEIMLSAAKLYSAKYLILDRNYPKDLKDVYYYPDRISGLTYLGTYNGIRVFRIDKHE